MKPQKYNVPLAALCEIAVRLADAVQADAMLVMVDGPADWGELKQRVGKYPVLLAADTAEEVAGAAEHKPIRVHSPLRLAVEEGTVSGFRLRLAGGREWQVPEVEFAARWRAESIVIARLKARTRELGPVALRGRIAIDEDLLQFEDFEVTSPSPVQVEGVLALTADEESALKLSWERLRWPGGARWCSPTSSTTPASSTGAGCRGRSGSCTATAISSTSSGGWSRPKAGRR